MKKKRIIYIVLIILIFMIVICFLGLHIIKHQIVENKKLKEKDILGEWSYDDSFRGLVTINFKNNGIMECKFSYPDKIYEYKYRLTYGSDSKTYIEIECDDSTLANICYFDKFQDIDIIDGRLYFLGGTAHPGFTRINKEETNKREDLKNKENKIFESYLGNYDITYNNELVSQDFSIFNFANEISIKDKCYWSYAGETPEKDIVNSECINPVDFEMLPQYFAGSFGVYYIYKIDDNSSVLKLYFGNIGKVPNIYGTYGQDIINSTICFKWQDSKTLVQTECVKQKNGYSSFDNSPNIDTKYEFKLTKKG